MWIFFGVGGRMGAIFQIKRFFDLKKLLFILPLIFCFSFSFSSSKPVARVCDDSDGSCACFASNGEEVLCQCEYREPTEQEKGQCNYKNSFAKTPGGACLQSNCWEKCYVGFTVDGKGFYDSTGGYSIGVGCEDVGYIPLGFAGGEPYAEYDGKYLPTCGKKVKNSRGEEVTETDEHGRVKKYKLFAYEARIFNGSYGSPFSNCNFLPEKPEDPPQADQKKVCANGECKCYNLTTGYEETCLGSPSSGGDDGSGSGDNGNSSGDNGSGSGNTGSGSGSGSGDSGNGQGAGSQGSPSAGNGTSSGAGGDNSGTGTGSNNGNNSGSGTHTGSSGNQHGGGGTSLGSGSDNGSDNGNDDGKEDGSEDGDDYCLKNPKSVVCNGEPKQGDFDDIVIPTKEVNDSWVKDMFLPDNGTCPAPLKANFLGKTISISYEPLCRLLNQVRFAILLLFAYISARLGLGGKL